MRSCIKVPVERINKIMQSIGCLSIRRTLGWVNSILEKDDVSIIYNDYRYHTKTSDLMTATLTVILSLSNLNDCSNC